MRPCTDKVSNHNGSHDDESHFMIFTENSAEGKSTLSVKCMPF